MVDCTTAGHKAIVVVGFVYLTGQMVEGHIAGADVESDAAAGRRFVGDVGYAAKIETCIVLGEKKAVADGYQRGSLSTQGHIEVAEVEHHGKVGFGSNGVTVANLGGESKVGLVENGVAMRGNSINGPGVFETETVDHLSDIMSQTHIGQGILIGRAVFERREAFNPVCAVGVGVGGQEFKAAVVDVAIGEVETVERGT